MIEVDRRITWGLRIVSVALLVYAALFIAMSFGLAAFSDPEILQSVTLVAGLLWVFVFSQPEFWIAAILGSAGLYLSFRPELQKKSQKGDAE